MHDDAYLELCAAHALGSLDPPEAARLQGHLASGCAQCREEMELHRDTVERMGQLLPARNPPAGAEARLMERIEESEATGSRAAGPKRGAGGRILPPWTLRIAAVLAVGVAGWMVVDRGRRITDLSEQMGRLQQTTADIQRMVASYELHGTDLAPRAHGHTYANLHNEEDPSDDELVLHVTQLEPSPEGKVYTAWAVSEGKTEEAGILEPDETGEGYASLKMPLYKSPFQIHLTLEDVTHGSGPTGPKVLTHEPPADKP